MVDPASQEKDHKESKDDHHRLGKLLRLRDLPLLPGVAQLLLGGFLGPALVLSRKELHVEAKDGKVRLKLKEIQSVFEYGQHILILSRI